MSASARESKRVLIVDDDPLLLNLLRALLEDVGYKCDVFQSGQEALAAIDAEVRRQGPSGWSPWDVLILDVHLPDTEGFRLLETIRCRGGFQTVPALFMSGERLGDSDIERGLALGALDYLAKPFRNAIFIAKVNNFAELGRFRRLAHRTALALEESETRYRDLFENIADPVFVHDFEGRILDVNEASCTRFGYTRDEMLNVNLMDLLPPECCATILDSIQVTPLAQPVPIEADFHTRDGQSITCEVLQRLIVQRDRKVIQSVARDITARKRAEEHLRWRNRELSAYYAIARAVGESLDLDRIIACSLQETLEVLEAAMGVLFLLGDEDRFMAAARYGISDEFVRAVEQEGGQGRHLLWEIMGAGQVEATEDFSNLPPAVRQAALDQKIQSLILIPVQSRGLTLGLLVIASQYPRGLHEREIEMLKVIGTEIGVAVENGRLYSAIIDSERRYRELFEGIGDPVLLHDFAGHVQAVNQAACSLLGLTEEDLLLENLERIGGGSYLQEVNLRVREADARGRLPLFESVLRARLDRLIEVEVHARIVTSAGRSDVLSVLRDVSGRKLEERRALVVGSVRGAISRHQTSYDYLNEVLHVLSAFAGCECVGIRVSNADGKAPYLVQVGFPDAFVQNEKNRDFSASRCVCSEVLRGGSDRMQTGFTNNGSFFCESLSAFFDAAGGRAGEIERTGSLQQPFESVALVPIHWGGSTVGLIHVADTRAGRVSLGSVEVLEEIGGLIGSALRQFELEESLAWETRQTEIGFGLAGGILENKPLEQAISQVLEQTADLTGFDIVSVERYHPAQDTMEMWVCRCPGVEQDLRGWIVPCSETLSGRVAKSGELIEELNAQTFQAHIHPALRATNVQKIMGFPVRHKDQIVGVLIVAGSGSVRTREQVVKFLSAIADQLAIAIGWMDAQLELDRSRRELSSLSAQLIRAQEDERARIARELHDSLGQILTSIIIDIDRHAARPSTRDAKLKAFLAGLRGDLNKAHAAVRHLTAELRPGILDDLGLIAALDSYLEEFEARTGIACHLASDVDSLALDLDTSVALYRVAQEALTNVARHARARHVDVRISRESGGCVVGIQDDGCGFDLSSVDWQTSYGMLGMRERLQLVGGHVQIVTQPGAGTKIRASVPMKRREEP